MTFTLLFGGVSFEHEISIVTAITVKKLLEKDHNLNFIFLDSKRDFYLVEENSMKSSHFSKGDYKKDKKLSISKDGFSYKGLLKEKIIDPAVIINLVHGGDGEDGKLASLLEFFNIDFIGPRVEASVVSFNKLYTKSFANSLNIPVLDYELLTPKDNPTLKYPMILKPLRLGSSIGIAIAKSSDEISYAKDIAFEYDKEVLVEPFIKGIKEYNLAGCMVGDEFIYSIVEEPKKEEVLDFDKKYLDFSRTGEVQKAKISQELELEMKEIFAKIYNPIFQGSIIRCDFFELDGKAYLNEINPIPGSMANYLFDDFNGIITKLASNLPKYNKIDVNYEYIHSIQSAKGK